MLVNVDAKAIEWVCALYWSQDAIGMEEYLTGVDIHEANQKRFNLSSRLIAKTLLFRIIYGGRGYSMSTDPRTWGGHSESWWDEVMAGFYAKYKGLHAWHQRLFSGVVLNNGHLTLPNGREYQFTPHIRRGEQTYPRTQVLNYPVQGLAADLVAIARVSLYKRIKAKGWPILFVNTVHDSIVLDLPNEWWYNNRIELIKLVQDVFKDIPANFNRLFGVEFNLPVKAEITYGPDMGNLTEI